MKCVVTLLLFSQVAFAQTYGNPGGGGPDDGLRNPSIVCREYVETLKELEKGFLIFWNKKFINLDEFLKQIEEIKSKIIFDSFNDLINKNFHQLNSCDGKVMSHLLLTRTHQQEEIKAIKTILKELEGPMGESCAAGSSLRQAHIRELKSLLELYEHKSK
jgi:hypothetical protein